jgi:hypothetical protein
MAVIAAFRGKAAVGEPLALQQVQGFVAPFIPDMAASNRSISPMGLRMPRPGGETNPRSGGGHDRLEPGQQVALHLVAIRLVEHLVPGARVDVQLDVGMPGVPVSLDEGVHSGELVADRILVADHYVDR